MVEETQQFFVIITQQSYSKKYTVLLGRNTHIDVKNFISKKIFAKKKLLI